MKIFLIVLAVIVVIFAIILSLSAEVTVVFDNGWHTRVKVLFIEKDIQLSKVLSFLVAPEKAAQEVSAEHKEERRIRTKRISKKKQNRQKSRNHRRVSKALTLRKIRPRKTLSLRFLMMTELSALCFLFQICFKPQTLQLQL